MATKIVELDNEYKVISTNSDLLISSEKKGVEVMIFVSATKPSSNQLGHSLNYGQAIPFAGLSSTTYGKCVEEGRTATVVVTEMGV